MSYGLHGHDLSRHPGDPPGTFSEGGAVAEGGPLLLCILSAHTDVCEKENSSGEEHACRNQLEKHHFRGWRGVCATVLQGTGSRKRSVFSQTPVVL